ISIQDDTGITSISTPPESDSASIPYKTEAMAMTDTWIHDPIEIVAEQTIPLGILCKSSKYSMTSCGMDAFNDTKKLEEYDSVHAITVMFSKTNPK
ncbi:MAG: hypothetical protein WAX04_04455, partial [Oscillospiraceae bacterium]